MELLNIRKMRVEFPSRRGHVVAVQELSLALSPGEILGVVGESGAGKSTIGNAIIGLLEPPGELTGGKIYLQGRRIDNLSDSEKHLTRSGQIGMVFQDPLTSLDPLQTIETQLLDTILLHLPVSVDEAQKRAVKLLDAVGILNSGSRMKEFPH